MLSALEVQSADFLFESNANDKMAEVIVGWTSVWVILELEGEKNNTVPSESPRTITEAVSLSMLAVEVAEVFFRFLFGDCCS